MEGCNVVFVSGFPYTASSNGLHSFLYSQQCSSDSRNNISLSFLSILCLHSLLVCSRQLLIERMWNLSNFMSHFPPERHLEGCESGVKNSNGICRSWRVEHSDIKETSSSMNGSCTQLLLRSSQSRFPISNNETDIQPAFSRQRLRMETVQSARRVCRR